ncbi:MAG TPA: hypothetical protein VMU39_27520 [Solirubrobacteraceae bacterium]|nr:hypothetical protein [Solirubrobacteraceae bacterium]
MGWMDVVRMDPSARCDFLEEHASALSRCHDLMSEAITNGDTQAALRAVATKGVWDDLKTRLESPEREETAYAAYREATGQSRH